MYSTTALTPAEIEEQILEANKGNKSAVKQLEQHYTWNERDFRKTITFFEKFPPSNDTSKFMFARALTDSKNASSDYNKGINILEQMALGKSDLSYTAIMYLIELYLKTDNISKALFFAKLEACQNKETYSRQSYLNIMFEYYHDNKDHMKLPLAMIMALKEHSDKFYKIAHYDSVEQNLSYLYSKDEIEYIKANYNEIIRMECAIISSKVANDAKENKSLSKTGADVSNINVLDRKITNVQTPY